MIQSMIQFLTPLDKQNNLDISIFLFSFIQYI